MDIAILQPGYLPWLGFFEQMARVDVFVLYNEVQYTKRDWRNRNRIKTQHGTTYLTVPVKSAPRGTPIEEIEIFYGEDWQHNHVANLKHQYGRAPHFEEYFEPIAEEIEEGYRLLDDLDTSLIRRLASLLGLETEVVRSSELDFERAEDPQQQMLNICRHFEADLLYNGEAGKDYLEREKFRRDGVELEFQEYDHPVYPQLHGSFVSHLSVVDLLFHCGDSSLDILTGELDVSDRELESD